MQAFSLINRFTRNKYANNKRSQLLSKTLVAPLGIGVLLFFSVLEAKANPLDSLKAFPEARIFYSGEGAVQEYSLALSKPKKINDVWQLERSHNTRGKLHTQTLELPKDGESAAAFDFYRQQLIERQARPLFECHSRDCGPSNSWANDLFKVKQLYGLDQYQHFAAFEIVGTDQNVSYVSLYSVRRGDKRVYVHVEWLEAPQARIDGVVPHRDTIYQQLRQVGFYDLPGVQVIGDGVRVDANHLLALVDVLKANRFLRITLVGHDYSGTSAEQQLGRSLLYAESVQDALIKAGIDSARLTVFANGSYAPRRRYQERVEVVITP